MGHLEHSETRRNLRSMSGRVDLGDDVEDSALGSDDEGPSFGIGPALVDHAIGLGGRLFGITQKEVIELQRPGVAAIRLRRVAARLLGSPQGATPRGFDIILP